MMKKIGILTAVCILMMLSANNTTAQTVDSGTTGDCAWTLSGAFPDLTLTISGSGAMEDYNFNSSAPYIATSRLSSAMEDYNFNSSAPWYSYCNGIKTLNIQQGVTAIGKFAFFDCFSLTSVTIGNSVTAIGDYAFYHCSGLTSITIPNSVMAIGEGAFLDCSGLTSITIPNSVTAIGNHAFSYCDGLTSVTIPNSVTTIGERAFYGCNGLTLITIKATASPRTGKKVFEKVSRNIPVYVPCGTLANYKRSGRWGGYFNNIIEDCEGTTSEEVAVNIVTYSGKLLIECNNSISNYTVKITGASGKEVMKLEATGSKTVIDLSSYAKGTYKVSVISGGKIIGTKNIVK